MRGRGAPRRLCRRSQRGLPSAPPKATDKRSAFEDDETWRFEALDPADLARVVAEAVEDHQSSGAAATSGSLRFPEVWRRGAPEALLAPTFDLPATTRKAPAVAPPTLAQASRSPAAPAGACP